MARWVLVLLLVGAIVCAGIGTGLLDPVGPATYGWTAYAPLSIRDGGAVYGPVDLTWLFWRPKIGVVLLAVGAGTTGAVLVAFVARRRRPTSST